MSEKAKRLICPKVWKVLDKKELNYWSSHLVPTKSLFKWHHIVISELTKHNRQVSFTELTNHNERDHLIHTVAALPMKNCRC